jgi:hypothetical protein
MSAALAFEHERECRVAADGQPLDRVHLNGGA